MTEREQEPRVPLGIAEVTGPSMYPTLMHGDQLLVQLQGAREGAGDVAVLKHPLQQDLLIVKRLVERRDGGWWVLGDNPAPKGTAGCSARCPRSCCWPGCGRGYRPPGDSAVGRGRWLLAGVGGAAGAGGPRSLSRRLRAR